MLSVGRGEGVDAVVGGWRSRPETFERFYLHLARDGDLEVSKLRVLALLALTCTEISIREKRYLDHSISRLGIFRRG